MSCPTPPLLDAAHRVLAYLHHHQHVGLRYQLCSRGLRGHSDSDWAVRHSMTGWVFTHGQAVISWSPKKQTSVALSSCEAKVVAASEAAKEALYMMRALFDELGLPQTAPTPLAMENKSAIDLAYNSEHHQRTKHLDRRHFSFAKRSRRTIMYQCNAVSTQS
eukprot:6180016-Pleurochrysis_carterae.AAC.1